MTRLWDSSKEFILLHEHAVVGIQCAPSPQKCSLRLKHVGKLDKILPKTKLSLPLDTPTKLSVELQGANFFFRNASIDACSSGKS